MDRAHLVVDMPVENLRGVGAGLYKDGTHIGLLCRDVSGKSIRLLHVAQHEDLRESDDASKCVLWVEAKVEPEQAEVVAAQARLIYAKNSLGGIPYGFSPYSGFFGAKGEIRWSTPGRGLTCSTFVLAAFDRAGVRLVSGETWPENRKEDIAFQKKMIEDMRANKKASAAHLKAMERDVGQVRFRPVEVAGALAATAYPCDFGTAESLGSHLLAKMTIASPAPPPPDAESA